MIIWMIHGLEWWDVLTSTSVVQLTVVKSYSPAAATYWPTSACVHAYMYSQVAEHVSTSDYPASTLFTYCTIALFQLIYIHMKNSWCKHFIQITFVTDIGSIARLCWVYTLLPIWRIRNQFWLFRRRQWGMWICPRPLATSDQHRNRTWDLLISVPPHYHP